MEKMDDDQHNQLSRRALFKSGIRAVAGIAIVSLTVTKTLAAETKLAKSAVQYDSLSYSSPRFFTATEVAN
jgi:hypothetical protein